MEIIVYYYEKKGLKFPSYYNSFHQINHVSNVNICYGQKRKKPRHISLIISHLWPSILLFIKYLSNTSA